MLTSLFGYINSIRPMSEEVSADLVSHLKIIEVPRHHMLLREGQRCDYIYVVLKGLLRMYYLKGDEEICSRFAEEQQMCLPVNSFFNRVPGYEFIETLEPCIIAQMHYDSLQKMYNKHLEYNFIGRVITQEYFIRSEHRLFLLRKQNAEERYALFCEHYPSLLQRVPLTHIASYLGITLETLSRIRKKLSTASHQ